MLIVDNILLFPFRGLFRVFREIADAVDKEHEGEAAQLKRALRELYLKLETGQISDAEFEDAEDELLDQLDELERSAEPGSD